MHFSYRAVMMVGLILATLVAIVAGCVHMKGEPQRIDSFYIVDGERIRLPLSPAARGVQISNDFDRAVIQELIKGLATLELSPLLERYNIVLVKRLPDGADELLEEAVRIVSAEFNGRETPIYRYDDIELVLINEFIVRFQPGVTTEEVRQFLNEYGAAVIQRNDVDPVLYTIRFNWFDERGAAEALRVVNELNEQAIVVSARPDFVLIYSEDSTPQAQDDEPADSAGAPAAPVPFNAGMTGDPPPCDPPTVPDDKYFCEQWGLQKTEAPEAWQDSTGTGVKIAVIDVGVWVHDDLPSGTALLSAFDAVVGEPSAGANPNAWSTHGTLVAGVVAARANDGVGIAGVAPDVKLLPIRIGFHTEGSSLVSKQSWICAGVQAAIDADVDIILSSMHWIPDSSKDCPLAAVAEEIVLVFSSGNGDPNVNYPANVAGSTSTIAVGASTINDARVLGSNSGPEVTVAAPGLGIWTDDIPGDKGASAGNYFTQFELTSSAAPFVAGVAALLLEEYPMAKPAHIKSWIENGADSKGIVDSNYPYGRVNAVRALEEAGKNLLQMSVEFPGQRLGKGDQKGVFLVVTQGGEPQAGVVVSFSTNNPGWLTIASIPAPTDADGKTSVLIEGRTNSSRTAQVSATANGRTVSAPVKVPSLPVWTVLLGAGALLGYAVALVCNHDSRRNCRRRGLLVVAIIAGFLVLDAIGTTTLEWALAPLTSVTAGIAKESLQWLGFAVSQAGNVLFIPGAFAYEIDHRCAGFWPVILFSTFVLWAYGPHRSSLKVLLHGIAVVLLLNWLRLIHLFWVGMSMPHQLALMHDVLWPVAMILSAAILAGLHPSNRQIWASLSWQRSAEYVSSKSH